MDVSVVHPVVMRSAEFWTRCSFSWLVLEMMGAQMVLAYSKVDLVYDLYVWRRVSFDFPNDAEVRALMSLRELLPLSCVSFTCSVKVSLGSKVRPRIFGFLFVGITWLFIVRCRLVLYSAGSGVNKVACDLEGFSWRSF